MEPARGATSVMEMQARFPDEASSRAYLRSVRWPDGFECPRCEGRASTPLRSRGLEQCRKCRYQVSLTAGTVLEGTHLPVRVWLWAAYFVGRHKTGISALQLQKDLGLGSYKTAWLLLHKLRSALRERKDAWLLTGRVDVDETYVGAKHERGAVGRTRRRKSVVVAAVESREHHAGSLRMAVVPDVSGPTLVRFVRSVVDPNNVVVHTDGWQAYGGLKDHGIPHNPTVQGSPERAVELLQWPHTVFANFKGWLRGTFHGVSKKHMHRYLPEFVYRFNRRRLEADLFFYTLRRAATGQPLTYGELVAEETE